MGKRPIRGFVVSLDCQLAQIGDKSIGLRRSDTALALPIARTFVISMNHQAGTSAVSVASRFSKAEFSVCLHRGIAKPWR